MNYSGLNIVAVRIVGLIVLANAISGLAQFTESLLGVITIMIARGKLSSDYIYILVAIAPSLIFLCLGLFLFLKAEAVTSKLSGSDASAAFATDGWDKLESILIGVTGLYFIAEGVADAQLISSLLAIQPQNWSSLGQIFAGKYLTAMAGGGTRIAIGLVFLFGRAWLARLSRKAA